MYYNQITKQKVHISCALIDKCWGESPLKNDYDRAKMTIYKTAGTDALLMHFHNEYEMIFIDAGSAVFTINDMDTEYAENTLVFINKFERHMLFPRTKPYSRYVLIIDSSYFDKFMQDPVLCSIFKNRSGVFSNGLTLSKQSAQVVTEILDLCIEEFTNKEPYWDSRIMAALLNMFIHLYRHYSMCFPLTINDYASENIAKIQNYIDSNYLSDLSLDSLSRVFNINKYHLAHVFKRVTGYSTKQYVLLNRISHAKNLLHYTNKSIVQIAGESGFNSASNFIRAFKSHEKTTPLNYRKEITRLKTSASFT